MGIKKQQLVVAKTFFASSSRIHKAWDEVILLLPKPYVYPARADLGLIGCDFVLGTPLFALQDSLELQ